MKKILLIGKGEVGSAIFEAEKNVGNDLYVIDPSKNVGARDTPECFDVTHICIPYSDTFIKTVSEYVNKYTTKLVIIHSTVAIGTTQKIRKLTKVPVVHSPIRGVHPDLHKGLMTFVKYVGGTLADTKKAKRYLESLGIIVHYSGKAKATELAKILSTSYYGYNILFAKQVSYMCKKFKVDYNEVYKHFNETYNMGYALLDKPNVIRPVLTAPEEIVGGHCITQNFELLPRSKLKKFLKKTNECHKL